MYTGSINSFSKSRKLIKALPNFLIFTNRKNLFIDQLLSKIQSKFKINWDHLYFIDKSKLIYIKNKVREKTLQYLKPYL